jgi:hypothetical protein
MAQTISGGCACGAIRYEANADPIVMVNCHCRDCQRSAGGGHAAIMVVPKAAVQLHGEPRYYRTVGDAGMAVERGFCPLCGSPVAAKLERMPDVLGLTAASLDDPSLYKPAMDIFTSSAHPWDVLHPDTQKLPQGMFT